MKICILTGEAKFYRMLELELTDWGFEVIGEDELLKSQSVPVLCDLDTCEYERLHELSEGFELYGWYKENEDTPSAQLCACIFKRPFLMSELRVALEKFISGEKYTPVVAQRSRVSEFGRRKNMLVCNHRTREAVFGSYTIALSETEADVLKLLCDRRGEVVTREELSELFGNPDGNICDVYICKLRRKIDNTLGVKFIYTVKGKGYTVK